MMSGIERLVVGVDILMTTLQYEYGERCMNHTTHKVLFQIFIAEMAGRFPDSTFFFSYRKMAIHSTFDSNLLIFLISSIPL